MLRTNPIEKPVADSLVREGTGLTVEYRVDAIETTKRSDRVRTFKQGDTHFILRGRLSRR
jgi:hypothetical protein